MMIDFSKSHMATLMCKATPNGENGCSHRILRASYLGIDPDNWLEVLRNEGARRVVKILAPYINRHVKNCADAHVKKFEQA